MWRGQQFERAIFSLRQAGIIVSFTVLAMGALDAAEPDASAARLAGAVEFLSSDELEGRGVGTDGLDKAADYIAGEFAKAGLRTELFDGSPFQIFQEPADAELGPATENTIEFVGPALEGQDEPQRVTLKFGADFNPLALGGSAVLSSNR